MAEGPYLIGIDGGTEGVRVGIFDREGSPVVFSSKDYELRHPHPGWAEQDPDEWWSCLVTAVREAMSESGRQPRRSWASPTTARAARSWSSTSATTS
jgi:sugar (pentulose or hexulose) kinase